MKADDLLIGAVLLVLTLGFFYLIWLVPHPPLAGPLGPGGFPALLAATLAVLSIALCWQAARSALGSEQISGLGVAAIGAALLVAYVLALPKTGFIIATPAFALAIMAAFGCRKPIALIAAPVLLTGSIYGVFRYLFLVPLP